MRRELWLAGAAVTALMTATAKDVRACGGCFTKPTSQNATVVTDHRMIFSISQAQTTLYDEIEYQGAPDSFAWVLPIHGQVTVGLSSDALFTAIDQATRTTVLAPPQPPCPSCGCGRNFASGPQSAGNGSSGGSPPNVNIISQAVVGPYATVQLSSTDPAALEAWLTANGYSVPKNVAPVIAAYVREGFDFLALKLVPGAGVSAMRPVSVTTPGADLSLPLRMVAAGTGSTVGITLWVVGDGRYEPKNFLQFVIAPSELVWDFAASQSNYTTLRSQKEAGLNNTAWQIESSLSMSPYAIENSVLSTPAASSYEAIPAADAGAADGGPIAGESADAVRQQDLATLFAMGPGMTRITRMRADLSQAALATDLVLRAAHDQTTMSNVYQATQLTNACPPFDPSTCGCGTSTGSSGGFTPSGPADAADAGSPNGGAVNALPARTTSGCAVGPERSAGSDAAFTIAGLLGIALFRKTKKKR